MSEASELSPFRLMLVDDHHIVRQSLSSVINAEQDLEVVGEAANGQEATALAIRLFPELILMDLSMKKGNGIDAIKTIHQCNLPIKIMVLSSFLNEELVNEAFESGAHGYMPKEATTDELLIAIRVLRTKNTYFHPEISSLLKNITKRKNTSEHITAREKDVMLLIAKGLSNQQIASELFIGIKTVKTHVSNILSKLELRDRTQVAIYALNNFIV